MNERAAGQPVLEKALLGIGARIHADAREFRPAIVRLEESAPSPLGRWVLWAALVFLASLLTWSVIGRLDVVAVAEGRLVPNSYLKIVQPADAGIVKEILVREGESVSAGQVLMRMDAALSDSDLKSLSAELGSKRLAVRRIDAELAGSPLIRRADEPEAQFTQVQAQYHANRQAYETALAQERATLEKSRFELRGAEEVRDKLQRVLPHYRSQEAAYEKLTRDGFAGQLMYTDKQRERIEKEQDLLVQESAIASARATIAQQERRIAQLTADYRRQLQTERVEIATQLERLTQELAKQEHRHNYLELRAPAEGQVKDLATHTVGTVVSPGTILMTLVPKEEALRAEVWVRNDDVGFVREQQPVKLKLIAFTFQKYGMLNGTVAHLSADASEQSGSGSEAASATSAPARSALAYRALVDLKTQTLEADGVIHRLTPGMQVSAEIHLGTRTVLEYLLSPVHKGFHEAARER